MAKYPDQKRNLNPHAEAVMAMWLWSADYAAQRGGSMDFWDSLSGAQRRLAAKAVSEVLDATERVGRSKPDQRSTSQTISAASINAFGSGT